MKFSLALICSALVGLAAAHNFSPEHIAVRGPCRVVFSTQSLALGKIVG